MKNILKKTVVGVSCTAVLATSAFAAGKVISSQQSWLNVAKNIPAVIKAMPDIGALQGFNFNLEGIYFNNLTLTFQQQVIAKKAINKKFTNSLLDVVNASERNNCKALASAGKYQFAAVCKSNSSKPAKVYGMSVDGKKIILENANSKQTEQLLSMAKNKNIVSSLS